MITGKPGMRTKAANPIEEMGEDTEVSLAFDKDFFRGKKILVFDDILTKGLGCINRFLIDTQARSLFLGKVTPKILLIIGKILFLLL